MFLVRNLNLLDILLKYCGYFFEVDRGSNFRRRAIKIYSCTLGFYRIVSLIINIISNFVYHSGEGRGLAVPLYILCETSILFHLLVLQAKSDQVGNFESKVASLLTNKTKTFGI